MGRITDELLQLVCMQVGSHELGVDIMRCLEILRREKVTSVPDAPAFVDGLLELRGNLIPCVDLRARLDGQRAKTTKKSRIVIVEIEDKEGSESQRSMVGLYVDDVGLQVRVPRKSIQPPPAIVKGVDRRYIQGVFLFEERMVMVIDVDLIFSAPELARLSRMGTGAGA